VLASNVRVTKFIRRLRGGSQAALVEASDGHRYAIKFNNNLQGPNIAFNEAMGTELFRMCNLPVPDWKPLLVTTKFLKANPECRIETPTGCLRPASGLCFGSLFLGGEGPRLFEILPETSFVKIRNRMSFWQAWVLDVSARHADNRQAIFVEQASRELQAVFIDHGHLFGGPDGTGHPTPIASRYLDPRVYPILSDPEVKKLKTMQPVNTDQLWKYAESLPDEWRTTSALNSLALSLSRLSSQQSLSACLELVISLTKQGTLQLVVNQVSKLTLPGYY
jgi:hypothetical protein